MKANILQWFCSKYPSLVEQMKASDHAHSNGNPSPHHMEGSVWIHTMMVFDRQEIKSNDFCFAALLHDIGKVDARRENKNGRVYFRGHANISMVKSIDVLNAAEKEFLIDKLLVLRLIAWHGELWSKSDDDRTEQNRMINHRFGFDLYFYSLLVRFTKADALGRIIKEEMEILRIEREFEYLENYLPWNPHDFLQHKPEKELVVLIGVSGSGKSTWLNNNSELKGHTLISVDQNLSRGKLSYNNVDYKKNIDKAFKQTIVDIKGAVKNGENVVLDMTNLSREMRGTKLSMFPSTVYRRHAVIFLPGMHKVQTQLKKRIGKSVPEEVIQKQMASFELPTLEEFHSMEHIF